jgi:hypothetical protein
MDDSKEVVVVKPRRVQLGDPENPDWSELYGKLWASRDGYDRHRGRYYTSRHHQPEEARLSQEGWDQIKRLIKERGIPVSVQNSCMGFSCSLSLWKPREEPYPGASVPAEVFFEICSHMLPGDDNSGFISGWAEFSPLFTSPENIERLKWSQMDLPRDASAYDY